MPRYLSRRLPADHTFGTKKAIDLHAQLTGEVVWAWNQLHSSFGMVFAALIPDQNLMAAHAIWSALTTDRAQRDVLLALAEWTYFEGRPLERIRWAINATNLLSSYRNAAIHTLPGFLLTDAGVTTTIANWGVPFHRARRFSGREFPIILQALRGDAIQLSGYVDWIASTLLPDAKHRSSPQRPVLRTPRLWQAPNQPRAHRKSKAPRRPPRSSRG